MLGIIGGTGLYSLEGLEDVTTRTLDTPFGTPSAPVTLGRLGAQHVAFLPRHGGQHGLLPHEINYRANIYALKAAGVTQVLSVSAVGSLEAATAPGGLALASQFLDFTKGRRAQTFFGDGLVAHVSTAEPTCATLRQRLTAAANLEGVILYTDKTYACVEGPRLGTKAESFFLRGAGAHLVGMTNVPEVFLAVEAQLCYATIAVVTDYDCWHDDPAQHVSVDKVMALYQQSIGRVQGLLRQLLAEPLAASDCSCRRSLSGAVVTPDARLNAEQQALLDVLRA